MIYCRGNQQALHDPIGSLKPVEFVTDYCHSLWFESRCHCKSPSIRHALGVRNLALLYIYILWRVEVNTQLIRPHLITVCIGIGRSNKFSLGRGFYMCFCGAFPAFGWKRDPGNGARNRFPPSFPTSFLARFLACFCFHERSSFNLESVPLTKVRWLLPINFPFKTPNPN
jgi:hypothetical protein